MCALGAVVRRVAWVAAMCAAGPTLAVPTTTLNPGTVGEPIRQTFLGGLASHVRTRDDTACVASRGIDITAADYRDFETGLAVPFAEIIRSHAASIQFVTRLSDHAESFRIQLKYSPKPGEPITLTIGETVEDVTAFLEPSGDSLRFTAPEMVSALRATLEAGDGFTVTAVSRDTRRRVTDRVDTMAFETYDACRREQAEHPTDPPSNRVAFDFVASPDPALRATDAETAICRVEDPATQLYRGRLLWTTGFFSQTEDVFVTFNNNGDVEQLYVPGIVEGRRRPAGSLATRLSISASANNPMTVARVSGCLGLAPIALCRNGDSGWSECIGGLAQDALFEDAVFLSNFELDGPAGQAPGALRAMFPTSSPLGGGTVASFGAPGGFGSFGRPRGSSANFLPPMGGQPGLEESPSKVGPKEPSIPAIPLPGAALLLVTALLGLVGARHWSRRFSA